MLNFDNRSILKLFRFGFSVSFKASQTLQRHYSQESVGTEADDMKGLPVSPNFFSFSKLLFLCYVLRKGCKCRIVANPEISLAEISLICKGNQAQKNDVHLQSNMKCFICIAARN